jgi:hypothetical protein
VIAEAEDTALLTDLAARGLGFVPVYSEVLDEVTRSYRLRSIGIAKGLKMEIFAITAQRRLQHPGLLAIELLPKGQKDSARVLTLGVLAHPMGGTPSLPWAGFWPDLSPNARLKQMFHLTVSNICLNIGQRDNQRTTAANGGARTK